MNELKIYEYYKKKLFNYLDYKIYALWHGLIVFVLIVSFM